METIQRKLSKKQIESRVKKVLNKKYVHVEVLEYFTDNNYYTTNDNIFEELRSNPDCVSYPQETLDYYKGEEDEEQDGYFEAQESLAYWTIYFKPRCEDIEVALECGLVPFYYNEEFYLALGGCGMDLSPKLDAYQALVANTIPKDSQFFRQMDYFEHVAGKELTKKVKKSIKRERDLITISFESEHFNK